MGSNPILAAVDEVALARSRVRRPGRLPGGGLAERSKAHAWKACRGSQLPRGFEPLSLRHERRSPTCGLLVPFSAGPRWVRSRFARAASPTSSRRSASHRLLRIAGLPSVGVTVTAMRVEMITAEDVELR